MRSLARTGVVGLLVGCLVAGPALASSERPLGSIIFANGAQVGSNTAVAGGTVFPGDRLSTNESGTLRVHLGSGQIYLPSKSVAAVEELPAGINAKLLHGTVSFTSSGETPITVVASDVLVRPKTTEPTRGQVELVRPRELIIASYRGSLEVIVGSQTYLVPSLTRYRLILDPQGPAGAGTASAKSHRALWITLGVVAVAAVVGVAAWRGNISNSKP